MGFFGNREDRAIRPRGPKGGTNPDVTPNATTTPAAAPNTVGEGVAASANTSGVAGAVEIIETAPATSRRTMILPSGWAGLPADWQVQWGSSGRLAQLTDTAWDCLDLNAMAISTMPPYLVGAAPSTPAEWLNNPDPDLYTSWEEFAKQLVWDYQLGEVFVLRTASYSTRWPARFHVVEPFYVNVEMDGPFRRYSIGGSDVTDRMLHIRYKSTVGDARGHGPLEFGQSRLVAAAVLQQYVQNYALGAVPHTLKVADDLTADEAHDLQDQWLEARTAGWGFPAILDNGAEWQTATANPKDASLAELAAMTDARIAVKCGVPPFLMGLPSGGDSMTYQNVVSIFDYHWRSGLRPKVTHLMSALSQWLLPRGTSVELNRDAYVQPDPLTRAQVWQILVAIGAMTAEQVQAAERILNQTPDELATGVLRG